MKLKVYAKPKCEGEKDATTCIPVVNAAHNNKNAFASMEPLVVLNWLHLLASDSL